MVKLSIIILNWNTKDLLKQCVESIINGFEGLGINELGVEIIIVDNGSTDGSVPIVKKKFPTVKLIENKENLGFAKGNNQGLKEAKGEFVMLLNSDTLIKSGAIEKLVEYLDKNPDCAVSPLLELPNGKPQLDYYMRFPNLWQIFLYHNPILRPLTMNSPLKKLVCQSANDKPFLVDQLPMSALMAAKEVWQKVGELDPDYHFFFEDVDWSWRAKKAGVKLIVVPQAKIVHLGGGSWKKKLNQDKNAFYRQFFASLLVFVKKNYSKTQFERFKIALAINFLISLKFSLFWDLIKAELRQGNLWQ